MKVVLVGVRLLYAGVIATLVRRASLRPFAAGAVPRVIEHEGRIVENPGKIWIERECAYVC